MESIIIEKCIICGETFCGDIKMSDHRCMNCTISPKSETLKNYETKKIKDLKKEIEELKKIIDDLEMRLYYDHRDNGYEIEYD